MEDRKERSVRVVIDNSYEDIAATYQCLTIAQLNEALLDNGIQDRETRKKICKSFAFHQGVFDDQFWFEEVGKRWFPILGFSETQHPVDDEPSELRLRSAAFEFHEYAFGNVDWFFDERDENASVIEIGN